MKIDFYSFGNICIDGRDYSSDVIIYPDHVNGSWWRKDGHNLSLEDLEDVFTCSPQTLIIGTGAMGAMRVNAAIIKSIEAKGIKVLVKKTAEACEEFNKLRDKEKAVAALHLTC